MFEGLFDKLGTLSSYFKVVFYVVLTFLISYILVNLFQIIFGIFRSNSNSTNANVAMPSKSFFITKLIKIFVVIGLILGSCYVINNANLKQFETTIKKLIDENTKTIKEAYTKVKGQILPEEVYKKESMI